MFYETACLIALAVGAAVIEFLSLSLSAWEKREIKDAHPPVKEEDCSSHAEEETAKKPFPQTRVLGNIVDRRFGVQKNFAMLIHAR